MYLIDAITKSILAKTAIAPASPIQCVVAFNTVAQYNSNVPIGPVEYAVGVTNIITEIVSAPVLIGFQTKDIRYISFYNPNTEPHDISIVIDDAGVKSQLHRVKLREKQRAEYNNDKGWILYSENGVILSINEKNSIYQANPGAVLTDLFLSPSNSTTKIIACNTSSATRSFRISIAPQGAPDAISQYIYYDYTLSGGETFIVPQILDLEESDIIRVYGSTTEVSFTISAKTKS